MEIFSYIEKTKGKDFDCSFSTLYTSIRGFFSNGGGGYLHFYHDQINKVVRQKYLDSNQEFYYEVHRILTDFYLEHIKPQLSDEPTKRPSLYHSDYLRQIVHHQIEANKLCPVEESFISTLRNPFYVREKLMDGQENELQKEYLEATDQTSDATVKAALKQWRTFSNNYAGFIRKSSHDLLRCAFDLCMNQPKTSWVYKDVQTVEVQTNREDCFVWTNRPRTGTTDKSIMRYITKTCFSCTATTESGDMVALSSMFGFFVYSMSTGEQIHKMSIK